MKMGITQDHLPAITVTEIADTPLPGKSLIEVQIDENPYTPITGVNKLAKLVGADNIIPTRILVESSQVNY